LTLHLWFGIVGAHTVTYSKKMRTKTLLLSAVAVAAGLVSVQAQSNVFSANVVGYVSTVMKGNNAFTLVANPLDDGNGNQLTNLVAALPNKSQVQIWDPVNQTFILSGKALGNWSFNTNIPPGTGFFVKNSNPTDITNVFVGSIVVANGASNSVALPANSFVLLGGAVPYTGALADPYNTASLNLGATLPNKSSVQVWDAAAQGFVLSGKALGNWSSNIVINPGQGAFIKSASATNWVESLQLAP
jgi:hypothetical protein